MSSSPRARFALAILPLLFSGTAARAETPDLARLRAEASRVTITRDDWGIAHVRGASDADAVFGAIYAQAEDDFPRIEANYLTALGRTAEAEGQSALWADLRQRLYVDPADLQARFAASPSWLRTLMQAWADGLNFYLATHPGTHPRVLAHFEPWMALSFTEGSIGGDIERISLKDLAAFYGDTSVALTEAQRGFRPEEPRGSNGIAIAPANTVGGHALLLINPHNSFYFRSELQMTSDAGLNVYGASTWGQFFIYQGFNEHAGWMHTYSTVDNVDEFAETVSKQGAGYLYRYGKTRRALTKRVVTIRVRRADGSLAERRFTTFASHHGPIVAKRDGKWIAFAMMWKPVPALEQSWLRTRTVDLADYLKVASLQANSSNDTLFADSKGEIAYLHPQFVPRRSTVFDYTHAVDGSDPATDWQGLHPVESLPNVLRPHSGYVFNTNNWPWTAAGPDSPKAADFPQYMDQGGENARGEHALLLLPGHHDFTPERLLATAFDSYLPAFGRLLPELLAAYDALPPRDSRRVALAEPVAVLRAWDDRWGADSVATSLAVFWGDTVWHEVGPFAQAERMDVPDYISKRLAPAQKIAALATAVARLTADFGKWQVPWGESNRFQRLDDSIAPHFDDTKPSLPVPFTSSQWGSLASYGARAYDNTKRWYGTNGNSFVAVVEFGARPKAVAVMAGGQSGDPASPHFADQIARYAGGALRPVYFEATDLEGHVERTYRPGE
ncbi:penicillin acylase family protein [soil metagenome]